MIRKFRQIKILIYINSESHFIKFVVYQYNYFICYQINFPYNR